MEIRGSLHIADLGFFADDMLDSIEIFTTVQHIFQLLNQFLAVFADAIKQI